MKTRRYNQHLPVLHNETPAINWIAVIVWATLVGAAVWAVCGA